MKSEIIDLTESTLTFDTEFRDDSQNNDTCTNINTNNNNALCRYLRPSVQTCINHKCNKNAFMCVDNQCHCRKEHLKCMKINTEDLINNLQEKVVSVESLEKCINQRVDEMIDSLSKFREDTISQMRKDFEYFGLNQLEKEFLRDVKSGKQETMTGKKIWEIINAQENQQKAIETVNWIKNKLQRHFKSLDQNFISNFKQLNTKIQGCILKVENLVQKPVFIRKLSINSTLVSFLQSTIKSKIINQVQEIQNLLYFFSPRIIKSLKILYRASENQFSTQKFHQLCDGIPNTLVLVETQFNKKIGGFTPIPWAIVDSNKYVKDDSNKSFVFSLSLGDKFYLVDQYYAVQHFSSLERGPYFGCSGNINIQNEANKNKDSCASINDTYYNQIHDQCCQDSIKSMTGDNFGNSYFKIKEWQVWKLDFDEN